MSDKYLSVRQYTRNEVESLLFAGTPTELQYVPVSVGMFSDDAEWAQHVCLVLAKHADRLVRGNAMLGLGHIARRFGIVDLSTALPAIESAKNDAEEYVRFQANDALDDIQHYVVHRK